MREGEEREREKGRRGREEREREKGSERKRGEGERKGGMKGICKSPQGCGLQ